MLLTLIRHTSVDVPRGVCYGRTDVPLAPTFPQEAEAVRLKIAGRLFDAVFTSPLSRARLLAEYCGFRDAAPDARLLELDFGEWEMKDYNELFLTDERFKYWSEHYWEASAPGGEGLADQARRVVDFIEDLSRKRHASSAWRVAAFCHGGILALASTLVGGLPLSEAFREVPPYGSVIDLRIDPAVDLRSRLRGAAPI